MLAAAVGISGCYEPASFVYGESLEGLTLQLYSPNVGIYPDNSVLEDPNNPFAQTTPGVETKWKIQSSGAHVAAFYSWATLLAREPGGEAQFYVGNTLLAIYQNGEASQEELPLVKAQAIRAYQSVLDNFPDAVTYDATGKFAYDLVTPAYKGITEMGGTVQGGWTLVKLTNGQDRAVKP
ncbi:putative lipoprotein [Archangium gephyra]|uniref:Lipoprotein n=1 Tax=Archangium gephyra TaxID=48 RepID=A0AAC8Q528_9BACT|nr:putative lipoprotein [Archangium gephyra]